MKKKALITYINSRKEFMNTALTVLLTIILCASIGFQLLESQDAEYAYYSRKAKKVCMIHQDKFLQFDKDLQYWKCIEK